MIVVPSILLILLVAVYFAWPKPNNDTDNLKDDVKITGEHNNVKTVQDKQFSLMHIENSIKQTGDQLISIRETASNTRMMTWGILGLLIFIFLGLLGHYQCVQLPRRSGQMELTDRQSDQLETIQDTLVAHGYLPTPRHKKARRKPGGSQEDARRKSTARKTKRKGEEDPEDEESCCSE